jgi:hypothetical protein
MNQSPPFGPAVEYWLDAWQRSILFIDVLRERGNQYFDQKAKLAPNVLDFDVELVRDGRTLPRPVNYLLVRIPPPDGTLPDPAKTPFVVVDPRAGHGPGIGGMKHDSEIGMVLAAGHPCYFIGFLPEPMPGQTIEDVCKAEAAFIEEVATRHPDAEGKPAIIANCQAGWQTMIAAAIRPDLPGPILLAGSPLSYWAGVRGKNPMRYLGGVLGGSWMTGLAGDLGDGVFDGANLVANFESLNPAHSYWQKPYDVWSKVDTEGERFLDFETWWGSPVLLNAGEMEWIVDNLFVGNKLAPGLLKTTDGLRIDLRNITSPIIVFCSWGDNITPPQQALGWIADLYDHEREIVSHGQTIVYTLHQTIGHLGIFVSGKVATKEYREFVGCMDMIELAPPGLYEAVITEIDENTENPELIDGRYLFRLEPRTLDDIRALVGDNPEDDRRFAAAARVSEVNEGLYRTLARPAVRAATMPPVAEAMRAVHPNRLRFAMFSDRNPAMAAVEALAKQVREHRAPVAGDNPFLATERMMSSFVNTSLDACREVRDSMTEAFFLAAYGAPLVQAVAGEHREEAPADRRIARDLSREADEAQTRSALETSFESGGAMEASLRVLFYVLRPEGGFDKRGFAVLKALRAAQPAASRRTMGELKALLKTQHLLFNLDEERAVTAIPGLLEDGGADRQKVLNVIHTVLTARGELSEESRARLARIETLFADPPQARTRKEAGA